MSRRVASVLVVALLVLGLSASGAWASPLFARLPGEMAEARYAPAAALLPNGSVLVAGGYVAGGKPLKTAEVFNPASGMFQKLVGELSEPRGEQAFAVLTGGKVLLAGGYNFSPKAHPLKTAELFDPETNTFTKLAGEMTTERDGPVAALLPDGKVLVTGGEVVTGKPLKTAELFNPATGMFEKTAGEATVGRYEPVAVTLPNGRVLIAGGGGEAFASLKSAELFDPETNTFEALTGPSHELTEAREEFAAVLLQNGRVLMVGGSTGSKGLKTTETFNFETNTFEKLPAELAEPRDGPAAAVLSDGQVLIVGGFNPALEPEAARYLRSAELSSVAPPTGTTTPATAVGTTAATLNGTALTEANGTAYFQYGKSTAYGMSTAHQAVDAGVNPRPVSANAAGLAPGTTYHFRTVVENAGGTGYGADQTFTTLPTPAIIAAGPPRVTNATESRRVWREGNKLAQITRKKRPPLGTTFSFTLNEQATVTFAFTQQTVGRKVKGRCLTQTKANRRKRACKRTLPRGTLSFTGHAGVNKVAFQGRISPSKKLAPGAYTLTIEATNSAGTRSTPVSLSFTIVR